MAGRTTPSTITVFASAARTATTNGDAFRIQGDGYRGLAIQITATALAATPSVVFTVQSFGSGAWSTHLSSAAVTTAAPTTVNLVVHPDAADTANLSENTTLPKVWRIIATHGDADSITYSVLAWPLR